MLTIALSKGRILEQVLPLLKKAGLNISTEELSSRKLVLNTNLDDVKVIILRASDVPVFVSMVLLTSASLEKMTFRAWRFRAF